MADINFGEPAEVKVPVVDTENKDTLNSNPLSDVNTNASEIDDKGMSVEELNDPNKIKVTIADRDTPVIVLFGPPACGKTMTLIRLSRFLQKEGYTVRPDESFRPSFDRHYKEMCDNFDSMINSEDAAASTSGINFMLVKVLHEGRTICQILEGPGEYYFKPESPHEDFPKYVNAIINSANRKIWAIMVEPAKTNERMDQMARNNYVSKIRQLKTRITSSDKVVFVLNKVDKTDFVVGPGNVKLELALKNTDYLITAKPKAHAFKNEMCFPLTKTKCELKKHPNSKFECFFNDFNRTKTSLFLPFPSKLIQDNLVCVLELQE